MDVELRGMGGLALVRYDTHLIVCTDAIFPQTPAKYMMRSTEMCEIKLPGFLNLGP
jgi:hypothetical protein